MILILEYYHTSLTSGDKSGGRTEGSIVSSIRRVHTSGMPHRKRVYRTTPQTRLVANEYCEHTGKLITLTLPSMVI